MKSTLRIWLLAVAFLLPGLATAQGSEGERLAYVIGCVNCHHQTPKEIINAPSLLVVRGYTYDDFRKLMKTGVTRLGRDLPAESNIMGIVAKEQFAYLSDIELRALHGYLSKDWSAERASAEEAKIPALYRAHMAPPAAKK